ncbi:MAG: hypothetical protein KC583_12620 [Myxococcales bacterium]|nr:hypothetical protein [Myxococcales bacterium]
MRAALSLLFALALPTAALAGSPALIVGAVDDGVARPGPFEVRRGQTVTLFPAVRVGRVWYSDAPALRTPRRVPAKHLRPLAALGPDVRVRWLKVEPYPEHLETPPPNPGNPAYSNSVLFGPRHGTWLGYDTLEYSEIPVVPAPGPTLTVQRARPTHPWLQVNDGLGTIRYKVVVEVGDGRVFESPGVETAGRAGIAPSVTRISVRAADDLVGHLTSFYNVPNVFGSAGKGRRHQTELHQGADCADVIVGAARKAGKRVPYTSVAGLLRYTRTLSDRLQLSAEGLFTRPAEGEPEPVALRWGDDLKPGDLMLIKYSVDYTGRTWDHIAVVARDDGAVPGLFDGGDAVMHMGYRVGLVDEPALRAGQMTVQFVRLR